MKMSQDWTNLIKVCTQCKRGKMACKPKINSKSQNKLKLWMPMLFLNTSSCIFAIKAQYCSIMCFMQDIMLIHLVFTFFDKLFPLFVSTSNNLRNSRIFLMNEKRTHTMPKGGLISNWPNLNIITHCVLFNQTQKQLLFFSTISMIT